MSIQKMRAIFHGLKDIIDTEFNLIDEAGYIIHSTDSNRIGSYDNRISALDLSNSLIFELEGYIYCYSSYQGDRCIISIKGIDGDTRRLAKIVEVFIGANDVSFSRNEFLKGILLDTVSHTSIETLCLKHDLNPKGRIQVLVIEATEELMGALKEILSALLFDEIVQIKSNAFAVINRNTEKDMAQPTYLSDTLASELLYEVKIGIGAAVDNVQEWHFSYRTAEALLELGRGFLPGQNTYSFKGLAIPLLVSGLPSKELAYVMKHFDCNIDKLIVNNELLATAQVFFKNNLNITDTSRSLYLHRNTLIYRLNKIHELTGFDLRIFDDAVLFNIMINGFHALRDKRAD